MRKGIAEAEHTVQQIVIAGQVAAAVAELRRLQEMVASDSDLAWGEMYYAIGEGDLDQIGTLAQGALSQFSQYIAQ